MRIIIQKFGRLIRNDGEEKKENLSCDSIKGPDFFIFLFFFFFFFQKTIQFSLNQVIPRALKFLLSSSISL